MDEPCIRMRHLQGVRHRPAVPQGALSDLRRPPQVPGLRGALLRPTHPRRCELILQAVDTRSDPYVIFIH